MTLEEEAQKQITNKKRLNDLYNLPIGEEIHGEKYSALRVPGGWLFKWKTIYINIEEIPAVFVPQPLSKKKEKNVS